MSHGTRGCHHPVEYQYGDASWYQDAPSQLPAPAQHDRDWRLFGHVEGLLRQAARPDRARRRRPSLFADAVKEKRRRPGVIGGCVARESDERLTLRPIRAWQK
jgi:hypothetical protein